MPLGSYDPGSEVVLKYLQVPLNTDWRLWQNPFSTPSRDRRDLDQKVYRHNVVRYMLFERQLLALIDSASVSKWYKITLEPEMPVLSWSMSEIHSNEEGKRMIWSLRITRYSKCWIYIVAKTTHAFGTWDGMEARKPEWHCSGKYFSHTIWCWNRLIFDGWKKF